MPSWSKEDIVIHQRILAFPILALILGQTLLANSTWLLGTVFIAYFFLFAYSFWPEKMSQFFRVKKAKK